MVCASAWRALAPPITAMAADDRARWVLDDRRTRRGWLRSFILLPPSEFFHSSRYWRRSRRGGGALIARPKRVPDHATWDVVIDGVVVLQDVHFCIRDECDVTIGEAQERAIAMAGADAVMVGPQPRQPLVVVRIGRRDLAVL